MQDISASVPSEWRRYWPLVLASALGFSLHTVSAYSIGLFMEPLGDEFGWTRAQISLVSVIPSIVMVLFSPSTGAFIDRWGSRRLAIPSILLTAASLAAISLANGSVVQWMGLWLFYGIVSLGVKATVWTTVVSGAFTRARGLALGVVLCGTAISQILAPPLSQHLIDSLGWRSAYVILGLVWGAPCLLLAVLFLHDVRRPQAKGERAAEEPGLPGLTFSEALRNVPLLRIAASTLITMFVGTATLIHQVPILTSAGVPRADAAWLASLAGVAGVIGKLLTGWMTDRWNASWIASISLTVPAIAYALLMAPGSQLLIVVAMMIIGYTAGTKLQLCAYLTSRYAGMAHYGKIFGVMTSIVGIGGGFGSVAAGAIFDKFGGYGPLLVGGVISSFVCGALLFRLGPYPTWPNEAASTSTGPAPLEAKPIGVS